MRRCKNCGTELNDDCLFCSECGKPIPQGLVCPHCGASVNEGDIFCTECGKNINEVSVEQSEEQESPQTPYVSESNTSKKILPIIVGVFVLAILGGGWWFYKSSKEEKVSNTESITMANPDEVEDVEDIKFTKFRKAFTIKNVLNLVANPQSKSAAQKCGLEFIYKDTQLEELDEGDYVEYYDIVYGYDVEKGSKSEDMGYIIKATSEHSCYFHYVRGQDDGYYLYFKDKADVDYLIDIAKDNGKCEIGCPESENGWYRINISPSLSSYDAPEENSDTNNGLLETNVREDGSNLDWLQGHWVYRQGSYEAHLVIKENTVRQYSSLNSESTYYTFRVEGKTMYINPIMNDGTDFFVTLDYQNHRIDYGDGNWMRKI